MHQDVGVIELGRHALGIGDEIGRDIALVEVHALDDVELGLDAGRLLDGDHAMLAHLFHGARDHVAHLRVVVGGHGGHLGDLLAGLHALGLPADLADHFGDGQVDAAA